MPTTTYFGRNRASNEQEQPVAAGYSLLPLLATCEALGRNIGRQLPLEQGDLILEEKLALLESLQLELILGGAERQLGDYVIEVAVLYLQLMNF